MVARLVWMQLLEGARFRELADENRIRLVPRSPMRGRLLDRKGRVLASSRLSYSLYLEPRLVRDSDWPDLRDRLARLLDLDADLLDQRRERGPDPGGYRTTLVLDLKPEQVLRFREQALGLKGAQVDMEILRFYPHGSLAAHALGYTQPITEGEYDVLAEKGYGSETVSVEQGLRRPTRRSCVVPGVGRCWRSTPWVRCSATLAIGRPRQGEISPDAGP